MSAEDDKIAQLFDFSNEEIALLTPSERQFGTPRFPSTFTRELSENFINGNMPAELETTYWVQDEHQVQVVSEGPKPDFRVEFDEAGNISVVVVNLEEGLIPYFEFDVEPSFNSSRMIRYPPLATLVNGHNLKSARGARLILTNTTSRNYTLSNVIKYPIRPHFLFLKNESDQPSFAEYAKLSAVLTYGIEHRTDLMLNEVYNFALHHFLWGDDRYMKSGYELFSSGVGGCGNVNNFVGEMLEMRGVRYRLVSGFNPIIREIYPGGGHSAIEVLVDGKWSFVDAYLDVHAVGKAAKDLTTSDEFAGYHVFAIDNSTYPEEKYGKTMTLGKLFRYRMYSDLGGRDVTNSMVNLDGREEEYGLHWELRALQEEEHLDIERDIFETKKLFVRGRFMVSKEPLTYGSTGATGVDLAVGEWVEKECHLEACEYFK